MKIMTLDPKAKLFEKAHKTDAGTVFVKDAE